ncbi:MAG: serine/threonine protein kinase [Deltaproteobacteria bacterium]|nr:MAG: serine/threonine protein kinase [Deltaproteobacteria bacterium]
MSAGPQGGIPFGRYELVRRIGEGGMGEVWLARDPAQPSVPIVIKRVLPNLAGNEDVAIMFLDEARIAARLDHPGCVRVFDLGRQDDCLFLAMEFISGIDLRRLVRRAWKAGHRMPYELIAETIAQAAAGLHYAHELRDEGGRPLGVIHRDVSPHNLMVARDGRVVVLDFGIAKAATNANVTAPGVLKGKLSYMSPEQATSKPLDRRSDIFSLGIVLWEACTGKRLFKAESSLATIQKIVQGEIPRPSALAPEFPPELEAIVLRALARDRDQRYPSAAEMEHALRGFLSARGLPDLKGALGRFTSAILAGETPPPLPPPQEHLGRLPSDAGALEFTPSSGSRVSNPLDGFPVAEPGPPTLLDPALRGGAAPADPELPTVAEGGMPPLPGTGPTAPPRAASAGEAAAWNDEDLEVARGSRRALVAGLVVAAVALAAFGGYLAARHLGREPDLLSLLETAAEATRREDWGLAVATYEKALTLEPSSGAARTGYTRALLEQKAKQSLDRARSLMERGEWTLAAHTLHEVPEDSRYAAQAARLLEEVRTRGVAEYLARAELAGRGEKAASWYERVLELDPENAQALEGLDRLGRLDARRHPRKRRGPRKR